MSLKESLKVLQALNALPQKNAEEVVEAWKDQVDQAVQKVAAKTLAEPNQAIVGGKGNGPKYTPAEDEFVIKQLHEGVTGKAIARKAIAMFGNRRTLNAYECRVSTIKAMLRKKGELQ